MKLSHIKIVTSFEVQCPQHPDKIIVCDTYQEAQHRRRQHHHEQHADDPPEPPAPRARGLCAYCGGSFPLRTDGTIRNHDITIKRPGVGGRMVRYANYKAVCPGSRRSPKEGT